MLWAHICVISFYVSYVIVMSLTCGLFFGTMSGLINFDWCIGLVIWAGSVVFYVSYFVQAPSYGTRCIRFIFAELLFISGLFLIYLT